jgi:7-cyano-7-deazaguanine reductase
MNFLGKSVEYPEKYDPALLQSIPRQLQRKLLFIDSNTTLNPAGPDFGPENLPFRGLDILNHYEVSYLLESGKPEVGILEIYAPADSPYLVESKSLKLYFNSLNMHKFKSSAEFLAQVQHDLDKGYGLPVKLNFILPKDFKDQQIQDFSGVCFDDLEIDLRSDLKANLNSEANVYLPNPKILVLSGEEESMGEVVEETLHSHLLKSNCLITGQPDWASIQIYYQGPRIDHASLLKYLISFRQHQEFHEHCIERIFMDILNHCRPSKLSVYGRYTRRGGIDINPFRSNFPVENFLNIRQARQ